MTKIYGAPGELEAAIGAEATLEEAYEVLATIETDTEIADSTFQMDG